jgi:hypothetical protein
VFFAFGARRRRAVDLVPNRALSPLLADGEDAQFPGHPDIDDSQVVVVALAAFFAGAFVPPTDARVILEPGFVFFILFVPLVGGVAERRGLIAEQGRFQIQGLLAVLVQVHAPEHVPRYHHQGASRPFS